MWQQSKLLYVNYFPGVGSILSLQGSHFFSWFRLFVGLFVCLFVLVVPWQPIAEGKNSKLTSYLTYFLKDSKSFMVKSSFFAPSVLISIWLSLNACRYHKCRLVLSSIATTWRGKRRNNAFSFIQFTYQKMVICVALPILAELLPSITNIDTCNKKV